jgi:hypothetical protein
MQEKCTVNQGRSIASFRANTYDIIHRIRIGIIMKKLTLSAEPDVVDMAKKLAAERGTSVSAMFSQFIRVRLARSGRLPGG